MRDQSPPKWSQTNFGTITKRLVNGGTPPTEVAKFWNGSIPWITGADFTSKGIGEFRRFVSSEAVNQTATNIISKGELLLVSRTGVGKLAIAPCDIAISQDITGVYADREQVDISFLYHRMRQGVEDLKKLNQGTSINGIIRDDLVKYRIELPPLPQQQRIAEILSTVDEAIEQTESLIAKTQQIKAGLMHDLFTRGVTPDGKLRPPRDEAPHLYMKSPLGWIPKDWTTSYLGDEIGGIDSGWSPNCESSSAAPGEWAVLKTTAVVWEGYTPSENKALTPGTAHYPHITVKPDDLLITRKGPVDRVGVAVHVYETPPNLMFPDTVFRTRLLPASQYYPAFMALLMECRSVQKFWWERKVGLADAQVNLNHSIMRKTPIARPDKTEQLEIVKRHNGTLSSIRSLENDLLKLILIKFGLMHDLLTGHVRVPVSAERSTTER